MNDYLGVTVVALFVWLVIISLITLLIIRQIGLITVRLPETKTSNKAGSRLKVGSSVPTKVISLLPQATSMQKYLFLAISSTCSPCRELVANMSKEKFSVPIIALLTGEGEVANLMSELLPAGVQVLRNPIAKEITELLQVESTPLVMVIDHGNVVRQHYANKAEDLVWLIEGSSTLQQV